MLKLVKSVLKEVEEVAIAALVWRLVTGAHFHGERRTDAGFFTHGTKSKRHEFEQRGLINQWEHKPRGHRMLWRWGCFIAFCGLIYGLIVARTTTLNALGALIVYGLAVLAFTIERKVRLRVHERHVITPIVKSLAVVLRLSPHAVRRMLHLNPEDIKDEGEVGYLELPPEITPGEAQQGQIEHVIDSHLPVDIEVEWRMTQAPKIGVIKAGLKPPPQVTWDEMVEAMNACAPGDVAIGKDRYKQPFGATFSGSDDPHWGFSVQSGSGKSNFLGIICAQILHQDPQATVNVIDPKRVSLIDYLGSPNEGIGLRPLIPGVKMANNPLRPQEMRLLVRDTYNLMERRALQAEKDRTLEFSPHLLVIDELNMFRDIQKTFWGGILSENKIARSTDKTVPELAKEDPMWAQIRAILRMGRFTNIHMVVVAQDLRDDAFGGNGARNYLGFRGLGNYVKKQWDMLVGSDYQIPQKGIGRWIFINAGVKTWVQITFGEPEKVYAWASHRRELHDAEAALALGVESVRPAIPTDYSAEITGSATDGHAIEPAKRVIVGLKEAAKFLGYDKPDTFRRARERWMENNNTEGLPGEYRVGRSPAWPEESLTEWEKSLPRRGKRES